MSGVVAVVRVSGKAGLENNGEVKTAANNRLKLPARGRRGARSPSRSRAAA